MDHNCRQSPSDEKQWLESAHIKPLKHIQTFLLLRSSFFFFLVKNVKPCEHVIKNLERVRPKQKCKKKLIHILQLAHFTSSIGEDIFFDMFMIFYSLPRDKNMVHNWAIQHNDWRYTQILHVCPVSFNFKHATPVRLFG